MPSTKANDKHRSVRVNRLAIPCGRFPARRPFLPAQPSRSLAFPHTASVVVASFLNGTLPPLAVIAGPDPRSPTLLGFAPVVASRHREARSDPFMIDLLNLMKVAHVPFWNLWVTMEDWSQDRVTNHSHTRARPIPYHRQPSLSSGCITQGLGEETFCLQQDGAGQGLAIGTSNLRGLLWQFRKKVILRRSSSSHVMPAWASAAAGICGCGFLVLSP